MRNIQNIIFPAGGVQQKHCRIESEGQLVGERVRERKRYIYREREKRKRERKDCGCE